MIFEHHAAKPYDFTGKCIINSYPATTVHNFRKLKTIESHTGSQHF